MFDSCENKITIQDSCSLHARIGWQALTKDEHMQSGEYMLITGTDFQDGLIDYSTCKYVSKERYEMDSNIQIRNDDVLVTKDGSIGKVAIVKNLELPATLNAGVFVIRPIVNDILPEFLVHCLKSREFELFIEQVKRGATISHLNQGVFFKFKIPRPPMNDQIAFVEFVRQVDKSKLMFQQMISRYDELVKSRFIEMFGDVVNNTKCWKSGKLQDVSEVTSSKRVFSSDFVESGIPFYRGSEISELSEDGYTKPEYYISRELYEELSKYTGKPKRGDILLPSICSKGELWVVDTDDPFYIKDGRVLWIKTDLSQMNSTFLRYMLRKYIVENFKTMASGSTFAEMKIFILKGIPVVIPPLDLQNQFADFVKQVDKSKFYFLR